MKLETRENTRIKTRSRTAAAASEPMETQHVRHEARHEDVCCEDTRYEDIRGEGTLTAAAQRDTDDSDMELTAGDLFDALYEQIALAKTRALMGETEQAHVLFADAAREYAQYADIFASLPGHLSLEHDLEATRQMLCQNSVRPAQPDILPILTATAMPAAPPSQRIRRRTSKAA